MALVLKDRVQETATANTTVSFSLAGAVTGFQTFSAAIGNANTTYYSATDVSGNWEVGLGTYATTGNLLTRTTIYASSNAGLAVTFSGTVTVFVTYPATQSVYEDASNIVSGFTISGGSINNTPIGATTPNTIAGTNISSATVPTNTVPALALTGTPNSATGGKTGVLGIGSNFTASDKNIMASFVQNINDYTQIVVQNPNAGTAASADFVVNNDNTTGTGVYGDFGINSSAFSGTGSLSLANATYLYSNGGDFVLGTNTANIVRFVINASTTDIGTITSTGLNAFPIGATTASTGAFTTLSASSTVSGTGFSTYLASPPAIGGTTAAAGSFTTLSASSTVSGTGFSTYLASPPAIGGTTPAAITGTTITDSIGNVRTIVQNAQSGAGSYTLIASDSGKHIYVTGTGGVTMPVSVFSAGQAITIVNNTAASITITGPAAGTMYLAGTATTGNRTLAQRGMMTVLYVVGGATPTIIASGSGLT